ncbi:MAG: DNA-processing protein DprA [Candidatus Eremiobacteraeota bacterium]|nr:DNA-processing protein DprA [Candidatus Eremiobacteraeota bacterium]
MRSSENLYVRGTLPSGGVAIIGSRTPPAEAARFAYLLASRVGEPVIAGLALGIDAAAHRGALVAGRPTVAFVGYGFGATYPPEHAALEEAIVVAGGAIATLCPPGTRVSDDALIERDRLQAEHARAVILVCSERGGGAMHTMRFARELGKQRFAVIPPEGSGDFRVWAGNRTCIDEGATAVSFDVDGALAVLRAETTL